MTSAANHQLSVPGVGAVDVTVSEYGTGDPILLLHNGGSEESMTGLAQLLTGEGHRVIVPVHPGFGGTPRPDGLVDVVDLARLYVALLDKLDVSGVTVAGNSFGGWITAELGLLDSPRVRRIILIDPVGISDPDHPMADMSGKTMDEIIALMFHNPEPFTVDPSTMSPQAQTIAVGNQAAMGAYSSRGLADPTLVERLGATKVPAIVVWGESDGLVDPDYGLTYASAIPGSRFVLIPESGHSPQLETPDLVLQAMRE